MGRAHSIEFTTMDEAHVQIADLGPVEGTIEHGVLSVEDSLLDSPLPLVDRKFSPSRCSRAEFRRCFAEKLEASFVGGGEVSAGRRRATGNGGA